MRLFNLLIILSSPPSHTHRCVLMTLFNLVLIQDVTQAQHSIAGERIAQHRMPGKVAMLCCAHLIAQAFYFVKHRVA